VSVWVCMASTVTTAPARSKLASRVRTAGISLDFAATASCPRTVPVWWSKAATRCGATVLRVRAPRMLLPSRAITLRWPTTPVRVHSQAPRTESNTVASRRLKVRRIADSDGTHGPVDPNAARRSSSASATHCPIAANDRAPAATAAIPTAKIPGSWCRIPRARRGSGTDANSVSNADAVPMGCKDAGAVREDGIGGCGPRLGCGFDTNIQVPGITLVTHATPPHRPQTCRSAPHQSDFAEALGDR
jgi:hypothetical protein